MPGPWVARAAWTWSRSLEAGAVAPSSEAGPSVRSGHGAPGFELCGSSPPEAPVRSSDVPSMQGPDMAAPPSRAEGSGSGPLVGGLPPPRGPCSSRAASARQSVSPEATTCSSDTGSPCAAARASCVNAPQTSVSPTVDAPGASPPSRSHFASTSRITSRVCPRRVWGTASPGSLYPARPLGCTGASSEPPCAWGRESSGCQ
jgi:hypothetical protein